MEAREVVVSGDLPPGKVEVRVRAAPASQPPTDGFWARIDRIRAERQASGAVNRSFDEIVADVNAMRDEWDDD